MTTHAVPDREVTAPARAADSHDGAKGYDRSA